MLFIAKRLTIFYINIFCYINIATANYHHAILISPSTKLAITVNRSHKGSRYGATASVKLTAFVIGSEKRGKSSVQLVL